MIVKRLKEWITTVLGLLLLAGACFLLYQGKITAGEFTAFLPVAIGLFWAKNSFITDMFKRGSGAAVLLLMLVIAGGCRTQKPPVAPIPPTVSTTTATNNTTSGGTEQSGYTKPDSSSLKALVACDSLGNVYIKEIAELKAGRNVKPSVKIKDNFIYVKCEVDSAAVFNKWSRFYVTQSDTSNKIEYLPGTVTNELTWLQELLVKLGWLFIASVVTFLIYLVIKLKF